MGLSRLISMIVRGFLLAVLVACCQATNESSNEETPLVTTSLDTKVSNLLPETDGFNVPLMTSVQSPSNRGRSDIEIKEDQSFEGYFYPKPANPFILPEFKTLDASVISDGAASYAEQERSAEVERFPRSPRRRPHYVQRPPPFIPGFIPPNHIRPLPGSYGRPGFY